MMPYHKRHEMHDTMPHEYFSITTAQGKPHFQCVIRPPPISVRIYALAPPNFTDSAIATRKCCRYASRFDRLNTLKALLGFNYR